MKGKWGIFTLLIISGFLNQTLFERDSMYSHISVRDEGGIRTLYFNTFPQTRMSLLNPYDGAFEYTKFVHLAFLMNPKIKKVLLIGLGGGSINRALWKFYPGVQVDTVEIDPMVVEVATKFFGLPNTSQHRVFVDDGRKYLKKTPEKYDFLFMDAYLANPYSPYIPFHLATKEFFELADKKLNPEGVIGFNVIGTLTGPNNQTTRAIYKTLAYRFGTVYYIPAISSMNVVLFGLKTERYPSVQDLLKRAMEKAKTQSEVVPEYLAMVGRVQTVVLPTDDVPLLTDEYAPIETLNILR